MVQLPPLLLYVFGAFLVVVGATRAFVLGWSRRNEAPEQAADTESPDLSPRARRAVYNPQKHIRWGLIWVALGAFLIISTLTRTR